SLEDLEKKGAENLVSLTDGKDARIYFALSCAAKSCPTLHNEAFRGDKLDEQLEAVTRTSLKNPSIVKVENGQAYINELFDRHEETFERHSGGIRRFIESYSDIQLPSKIDFMDHDWSLNSSTDTNTPGLTVVVS